MSLRHCEKIHVSGKNKISKNQIKPHSVRTKPSGCSLAIVLGVISPKISTVSVVTTVDTVTAADWFFVIIATKNIVASDVRTILTILLPISTVVISLS